MKHSGLRIFFALACCLFFLREAHAASTYTYASIDFDDATGIVSAYARTEPDYSTNYYYRQTWASSAIIYAGTTIYDGNLARDNATAYNGAAEAHMQVEGEAGREYEVYTAHRLAGTIYVYNYYNNGSYQSGYRDPYDYGRFEGQQAPAYYVSYTYTTFGPEIISYNSYISLGDTYKTVAIGEPHHLQVIFDRTITDTENCGRAVKLTDFKAVDVANHGVGRLSISEQPQSITDSCTGYGVLLNPCSPIGVNQYGIFTDVLRTGCPVTGDPNTCGYDFGNTWRWCNVDDPSITKNIAWMYYNVRHSYVMIDGELNVMVGQYKYP